MTNRAIVTSGKHGTKVYDADDLHAASRLIINERIEGGYYDDEAIEKAKKAIEAGRPYGFLQSRKRHEYEDFELLDVVRAGEK